jgi:cell wall-associated NlpC family hydrolase
MHRLLLPALLAVLVLASSAAAAKPRSWAQPQIKLLTAQGLLGNDPATFRPDDPATRGDVAQLLAGLAGSEYVGKADAARTVTMAGLDSRLVSGLGLADAARTFAAGARAAGLAPPARFGTEAVARLLGLRTNHPASQDDLELLPADTATRAELAYSGAQMLRFRGWEAQAARAAATSFTLPALTPWQKRILGTAFRFIGYPYVWGGTSEHAETPAGVAARGGFDCSGFVWRVYKLEPYAGEGSLAAMLQGRTTFAMSGEVPKGKRIPFARLQPADVIFFGSSGYGVALARLDGWYAHAFAWGRRPLAEAGLVSSS